MSKHNGKRCMHQYKPYNKNINELAYKAYNKLNDDQLLKHLTKQFDPYVKQYILKYNPVFVTERNHKKVLHQLMETQPMLVRHYIIKCPNLKIGFPEYHTINYVYVDRVPALITDDGIEYVSI